jgi:hypothetical protein
LARFEREARVLAALNHPNIGGIYGVEESDGVRALVLELVEGPTLADRLTAGAVKVPEALTGPPPFIRLPLDFCDQATPFLTQIKGLATYTIPRIDVQVAGTIQSRPYVGTNFPTIATQSLAANWLVFNAQVAPELGRPLSGNAATAFVNLVEPGSLYGERLNQVDLRFAKIVRYGRTRTNVAVDLFNISNASPVTTFNQTFSGAGANWLQPTSILAARIVKLSVQFDW